MPWCCRPNRSRLAGQAQRLLAFVAANPDLDPIDVGWSLVRTRAMFGIGRWSWVLIAGALLGLAALATGESGAGRGSGSSAVGGEDGVHVSRPKGPNG